MLAGSLVLAGAAGGAVLGVTRPVHHRIAVPPAPPPAALTLALTDHRALLDSYDAVSAAPGAPAAMAGLRGDIAAHVEALRAVLEVYPGWRYAQAAGTTATAAVTPSASGSPTGTAAVTTVAGLHAAVLTATTRVQGVCLGWPVDEPHANQVVPLLGSIAACLVTHAEVLS